MITVYITDTQALDMSSVPADLFGDEEAKRISAIKNQARRLESIGGLWALKKITSFTPTPAIYRDRYGKPRFCGDNPLPFGISHSHGIAAAAIADSDIGDIGFDIEVVRDIAHADSISKRFFSEKEIADFKHGGGDAAAFFKIWTAKEAYAKLDGTGIAAQLSNKTDTDGSIFLSQLKIEHKGRQIILAVACKSKGQAIQIFTDTEDNI